MARTLQGGKVVSSYPWLLREASNSHLHFTLLPLLSLSPPTAYTAVSSSFFFSFSFFFFFSTLFFSAFLNQDWEIFMLGQKVLDTSLKFSLPFHVFFIFQNTVYFTTKVSSFFHGNSPMSLGYNFESVELL